MNQNRRSLVTRAFRKLDKTGDNEITVDDLKGVYNVKKHPKFISGEMTEEEILGEFLTSFDTPSDYDGKVNNLCTFHRF